MKDFHGVLKNLKKHIANGVEMKVMDKDVAQLLNISQAQLATLKRRNSMPYSDILAFCEREGVSCKEIFFD
jgi:hypothetical protein